MWDPTFTKLTELHNKWIFQSTGPVWDPTGGYIIQVLRGTFQSTGPVWDPTNKSKTFKWLYNHFNLRVPCGTRRNTVIYVDNIICISIHGSRVGPDNTYHQSEIVGIISIHGSRVGPDSVSSSPFLFAQLISIHGSRVGPDKLSISPPQSACISIHGSRVGPDRYVAKQFKPKAYFNPRVPCGTRLALFRYLFKLFAFQSTGPVWDPTQSHFSGEGIKVFQSTGPVWDPTAFFPTLIVPVVNFNPRVPCGTRPPRLNKFIIVIIFQSTGPVWDPTFLLCLSIRSFNYFNPRVPCGTRPSSSFICNSVLKFQSTGPVWDPTYWGDSVEIIPIFQSTGPVWDPTYTAYQIEQADIFQSTGPVWDPT